MSTTDEAFSLHSSSIFHSGDIFTSDLPTTPEPDSANGPSYTYPPQGSGPYGYIPTTTRSRSHPTPLLPLHHDPLHSPISSSPNYPPLERTWERIRAWLSREIPELGDTLNYGILPQDFAQIEMQFGFALPPSIRDSYLIVDGQEPESAAGCPEGLFFGLTLLPLEDVYEEWKFWREVDEDTATGANPRLQSVMQSIPPGWIRKQYSQRGWIPLIADKAGNYLGVDLNPGEGGSAGQVIVFGRDFDTKVVMWKGDGPDGWAKWLASFAEELESGETFEVGGGNDASDGSEDGVGYDSYFGDGHGRGQGEGGGDSAFGGLRLIGEYRGWSTLEAWADRSLRKWYEVGLVPPPSIPEESEEKRQSPNLTIDVLDFDRQTSVAESSTAAIDRSESTTRAPSAGPSHSRQSTPHVAPASRLPAPRPVELPTADDIIPPINHDSSYESDLEAGPGISMREVSYHRRQNATSFVSPNPPRQRRLTSQTRPTSEFSPAAIPLPSSPVVTWSETTSEIPPRTTSPSAAEMQDFLEDSGPPLHVDSIEPTSPLSTEKAALPSEVKSEEDPVSSRETDVTVRLVGVGGHSGAADSDARQDEAEKAADNLDTPKVEMASQADPSARSKKAEKRRSGLPGLKQLRNLGGLRKKDSRGSVKEMMN